MEQEKKTRKIFGEDKNFFWRRSTTEEEEDWEGNIRREKAEMSDIFIFENTKKNVRPWRMNRSKASAPDVCNSSGAIVSWSRLKSFFKLL